MFGELRDRQAAQRHEAAEHGDDRDDDGDDRAADEEGGHVSGLARARRGGRRSRTAWCVTLVPAARSCPRVDDHAVAGARGPCATIQRVPIALAERDRLDAAPCRLAPTTRTCDAALQLGDRALRHEQRVPATVRVRR